MTAIVDSIRETEPCWKCHGSGIIYRKIKKRRKEQSSSRSSFDGTVVVDTTATSNNNTSNNNDDVIQPSLATDNDDDHNTNSDHQAVVTTSTTTIIPTTTSIPTSTPTRVLLPTAPNETPLVATTCTVCQGKGIIFASQRSIQLGLQPGKIIPLRGRGEQHPRRFAGVPSVQGYKIFEPHPEKTLQVKQGEILASLGCGDWRIYQLANGHKLTVDDFLCAWYAAKELRNRGYGVFKSNDNDDDETTAGMFGQLPPPPSPVSSDDDPNTTNSNDDVKDHNKTKIFHHADIGCGCGSVLMTMAWAFPQTIRSHGVEAQEVSFDLCRRGLQFNLGQDGSHPSHTVQLTHSDLRTWDGGSRRPYDVITGTPPYFPKAHFVGSQNHSQKIRCRIPTRGTASDYVTAASKHIRHPDGIFCIVETARKEGEEGMWKAIHENNLHVLKRLDVIPRTGLPPRFSCWLLTPQNVANQNDVDNNTNNKNLNKSINDETTTTTTTRKNTCIIETLTIRNKDQSRTLEYVEAMESMGWVDFERTKEKQMNLSQNTIFK